MENRTRFAPSPTGYLHIGSARTALFCWLFARQQKGTFILRIEDTDLERSSTVSIQAILDSLEWLGLDYDEGPYYQTERLQSYRSISETLIQEGKAYRCVCSKQRLENLRAQQLASRQKPRYDGHCRDLSLSESEIPHVIRFRTPQEGQVSFDDLIRGEIVVNNSELDDLVIVRSDGMPTYNFSAAIDDWDMHITHVLRGDDHINNTPRQIHILQALGASLPYYAHLPMILGSDGKRLSKRHGAVSVLEYREQGYLPEALLNYLVRLGWSHKDQEIFSMEEMIHYFNIRSIQRSPAAFNPEKLAWINQHYMKTLDSSLTVHALGHQMERHGIDFQQGPPLEEVLKIQVDRCKTLAEMAEKSRYFYNPIEIYDQNLTHKYLTSEIHPALSFIQTKIRSLGESEWTPANLHQIIQDCAIFQAVSLGKIAQPLRVAVTGGTVSPPIDSTLFLIGKNEVLLRLEKALQLVSSS